MNNVEITQLEPIKVPLVKKFYKEHYPAGKVNKSELIYSLTKNHSIIGIVRFRAIEEYRLLTGMVISTELRGQGHGSLLMNYCVSNILTNQDFCFAYRHLESFYSNHDFKKIDAVDLPNSLKTLFLRYTNSGKDLIPMHFQANC
ncbi:GNAT family N-acetyltransferase [Vibrio sp. 99-70-13A1]|uniref:GNAT family N-acetyltransferase n=1 Tax=Vibrio sp. 99-70-13A1 TaxID=2607601 RepID=UPI001493D1A5|nr:GNAT family N-acetyltransferase [Vibrio sp. 99-70-13A1]NOH99381.1 GNAT family N-acetyltransferase [Vibrio sp. 99-70-13A1]